MKKTKESVKAESHRNIYTHTVTDHTYSLQTTPQSTPHGFPSMFHSCFISPRMRVNRQLSIGNETGLSMPICCRCTCVGSGGNRCNGNLPLPPDSHSNRLTKIHRETAVPPTKVTQSVILLTLARRSWRGGLGNVKLRLCDSDYTRTAKTLHVYRSTRPHTGTPLAETPE